MGRPSKPIISKDRAARAALAVIDSKGIDGLSLQLVAKKLGVKAPSLYYHFKDKNAVLAEVARLMLADVSFSHPANDKDWKKALIDLSVAARNSILKHPKAAPLMVHFFPRHLMLEPYDAWAARFDLPKDQLIVVLEGMEKLTFGSAMLGAMSRAQGQSPMPDFDPKLFPNLDMAVKSNTLDEEALFVKTLERFLSTF